MFLERKYHFRYHKTCLEKEESTSLCVVCLEDGTVDTFPHPLMWPGTGSFLLTCRFSGGFTLSGLIQQDAQSFLRSRCLCHVNLPDCDSHSWLPSWVTTTHESRGEETSCFPTVCCPFVSFLFCYGIGSSWLFTLVRLSELFEVLQSCHDFSLRLLWNDVEIFSQHALS